MRDLEKQGYREVTLLGQNVNSYLFKNEETGEETNFPSLLRLVANEVPNMRIRFSTPHPKDMGERYS